MIGKSFTVWFVLGIALDVGNWRWPYWAGRDARNVRRGRESAPMPSQQEPLMATLTEQLAAMRLAAFGDGTKPGRIPPDAAAVMHRVTAEQPASGYRARMPAVGSPLPGFALPDTAGAVVDYVTRMPDCICAARSECELQDDAVPTGPCTSIALPMSVDFRSTLLQR